MTFEEELKGMEAKAEALKMRLRQAAKDATMRAVETATDETPPDEESGPATNMRTGELKQHWATDSEIEPKEQNGSYVTSLANNVQYASYVNDGHRMDQHFVPGLAINPAGGLDMNADGSDGMVVGTRTTYVPGKFMADKAEDTYNEVLEIELNKLTEELNT